MKKIGYYATMMITAFTLMACASDKKSNQSNTEGTQTMASSDMQKAPAFTLQDKDGNNVSLSDFEGKVVILDFWATWCPPCRQEIPHFIELQNAYGEKGLQVVGVSLDQQGWGVVVPFAEQYGIQYPLVLLTDPDVYQAYQEQLPSALRGSIPFTFILDRKGNVIDKVVGYRDKEYFEEAIKPLL